MALAHHSVFFKWLGFAGTILIALPAATTAWLMITKKIRTACEWWLLIILAVTAVSYFAYNLHWGNSEGRFFFPALASLAYVFIVTPYNFLYSLPIKKSVPVFLFIAYLSLITFYPYLFFILM